MIRRGNGYAEYDKGRFEAVLTYNGETIAETYDERVIAYEEYKDGHGREIETWTNEYGYELEWR